MTAGLTSPATAAAPALSAPVEDFSYPGAAKILADRGITLKSGDGHIVLADCASGPGLVQLYSRAASPSEVCFRITDRTGSLTMEIPQVYNIKGDDHTVKATLNTDGKVSSVDVNKNAWTPVGEGSVTGATTLLQLNATDGPAASTASDYPAIGRITVGQAGEAASHGCTGTLIAPQWVLTAANCFGAIPSDPPQPASWYRNRHATATFGSHSLTVTGWTTRPDRDVALARLASPIADIAPASIGTTTAAVGQSVRTGGSGRTATEWLPSVAHAGTATVTAADATTVTLTPATGTVCKGDAGGPTFNATGAGLVVSGVHSLSGQAGCLAESSTTSQVTDARVDDLASWITANTPRSPRTSSDFNGDGKTDIALTGGPDWTCLPVAVSKGDGTFDTTCNSPRGGDWGHWAHTDNVKVVTGDFAGNGRTDLLLTGGAGWTCLPVAMSKGDGTFDVSCNTPGLDWSGWASQPGVQVITGDFNGDGRTDVALTGGPDWTCLPVAMSKGDGTFDFSCNAPGGDWGHWAHTPNVKALTGDFNGDGKTDIALTGGAGWDCLPVLMSKGDGTFDESCNAPGGYWGDWAATANVKVVTGDFNGDGKTDLLLTGGAGWDCLPVLLSRGNGTFSESCNKPGGYWGDWASQPGVKVVAGDFNGDGRTDVVLTGGPNWDCLPMATAKGDDTFDVSCNKPGGYWGDWAHTDNVKVVAGDFNGDGRTDLALTGGAGWDCLPVLMSKGDTTFTESCNASAPGWSGWASTPGVTVL